MTELGVGIDAVCAAGHDDRIHIGAGFGAKMAVYKSHARLPTEKGLIGFSQ